MFHLPIVAVLLSGICLGMDRTHALESRDCIDWKVKPGNTPETLMEELAIWHDGGKLEKDATLVCLLLINMPTPEGTPPLGGTSFFDGKLTTCDFLKSEPLQVKAHKLADNEDDKWVDDDLNISLMEADDLYFLGAKGGTRPNVSIWPKIVEKFILLMQANGAGNTLLGSNGNLYDCNNHDEHISRDKMCLYANAVARITGQSLQSSNRVVKGDKKMDNNGLAGILSQDTNRLQYVMIGDDKKEELQYIVKGTLDADNFKALNVSSASIGPLDQLGSRTSSKEPLQELVTKDAVTVPYKAIRDEYGWHTWEQKDIHIIHSVH